MLATAVFSVFLGWYLPASAATYPIANVPVLFKSILTKQVVLSNTDENGFFRHDVPEVSGLYDVFVSDGNLNPMKITAKQGVVSGRIVILTDDTAIKGETVPIQMTVKDFVISPSAITANLGDTLKITFTGDDTKYSFYLPEFKLKSTVAPKQTKTFSFKVSKKGKFILKAYTVSGGVNKTMTSTINVI